MKTITDLTKDPAKLIGQTSAGSRTYQKETARLVNELFDEFRIRCRNWEKTVPHAAAAAEQKRDYVKRLTGAGITNWDVVLKAKERVCSELRWFQKADDFVEICRSIAAEMQGLPSEEEAFRQATNPNTKKHGWVLHTLREMDTSERDRFNRVLKVQEAERFWAKRWRETVLYALAGNECPEPELELEEIVVPASSDFNRKEAANLLGIFD